MPSTALLNSVQHRYRNTLSHYHRLRRNERRLVLVLALALAATALYAFILQPVAQFTQRARASLDKEQATLAFVQSNAATVRQINNARQEKTGQDTSLLALISKTAEENRLTLQRYEPAADNKLTVWLSDTEFNTLLTWLDALSREYHIQIERVNITPSMKPGMVEVQLVLRQ